MLTNIKSEHNHPIDEQIFRMLPKQRKLDFEEKSEFLKLKALKCNKTLMKEYMKQKTGKNIILKDLTNIKGKNGDTDLQKVMDLLHAGSDSVVQVLTDEQNELKGIYYQSKFMKKCFANYPELLLFDATYKLNNLRMPLNKLCTKRCRTNYSTKVSIFKR